MRWPPYPHVFFDCDSTLTRVEGIDVLADTPEKRAQIATLTDAAMNGDLDLAEVYARRLQAIQPTRADVQRIRRIYKKQVVEDARSVIDALQALGQAGLYHQRRAARAGARIRHFSGRAQGEHPCRQRRLQ